jgi:hypothetical protein
MELLPFTLSQDNSINFGIVQLGKSLKLLNMLKVKEIENLLLKSIMWVQDFLEWVNVKVCLWIALKLLHFRWDKKAQKAQISKKLKIMETNNSIVAPGSASSNK